MYQCVQKYKYYLCTSSCWRIGWNGSDQRRSHYATKEKSKEETCCRRLKNYLYASNVFNYTHLFNWWQIKYNVFIFSAESSDDDADTESVDDEDTNTVEKEDIIDGNSEDLHLLPGDTYRGRKKIGAIRKLRQAGGLAERIVWSITPNEGDQHNQAFYRFLMRSEVS